MFVLLMLIVGCYHITSAKFIDDKESIHSTTSTSNLSALVTWENRNKINYISQVKDQQTTEKSWAFATTTLLETKYNITKCFLKSIK